MVYLFKYYVGAANTVMMATRHMSTTTTYSFPHLFPLLCGVDGSYETPPFARSCASSLDNSLSDKSFLMLSVIMCNVETYMQFWLQGFAVNNLARGLAVNNLARGLAVNNLARE